MATVLEGKVDGILLTGGLLRFDDMIQFIHEHCSWIAPIYSYPGEFEQEAMAYGALDVLNGKRKLSVYTGKPVWSGFTNDSQSWHSIGIVYNSAYKSDEDKGSDASEYFVELASKDA